MQEKINFKVWMCDIINKVEYIQCSPKNHLDLCVMIREKVQDKCNENSFGHLDIYIYYMKATLKCFVFYSICY